MKDKIKIFEQAKEVLHKNDVLFIEELISMLPLSKGSFYNFYPVNSDAYNEITEAIDTNKVRMQSKLYRKWFDSESPALQIALMKLIASESQAHRINGSRQSIDHTTNGKTFNILNLGSGTNPEKEA